MGMCQFGSGDKKEEELDQGCHDPRQVSRGVTDPICLLVFLICLAAQISITGWAAVKGDLGRYKGLPNTEGEICGYDTAVKTKKFVFFCVDPAVGLSVTKAKRECIETCPTKIDLNGPCGPTYPTKEYGGMVCMPTEGPKLKDLKKTLEKHPTFKILMEVSEIPKARVPIACSAAFAIIGGFLYLLLLQRCTCLVWVGLYGMVLVSGAIGAYFGYAGFSGGTDGLPHSGDAQTDYIVSAVHLIMCFVFTCIVLCKRSAVEQAMNSIKAACECIWDCKTLLLEPFVSLAIKGTLFLIMLVGLLLVYTCKEDVVTDGGKIRFSYSEWHNYIVAFYIFMIFWVLELCNAMSQFVVSYAVEMWFFSSYNSQMDSKSAATPALQFAVLEGYIKGVTHHFGSLAFGSFVIACFRFVQLIMGILIKQAENTGNPVGACIGKICLCIITCFKKIVEHLNKNAYMDIALNGNNFCPACFHAMKIMAENATAIVILTGASWIFELAGVGGITAGGVGITFAMLKHMEEYNDPASKNYIPEPTIVCVVSGVLCLVLVLPFILIFGQAADTILFCFAIDKKRNPAKTAADTEEHTGGMLGWIGNVFSCGQPRKQTSNGNMESAKKHGKETEALLANAREVK